MGRRRDLSSLLGAPEGGQAAVREPVARDTYQLTVPLTDLTENPDNPRHELRDLDGLAETLRERGVLQALGVVSRGTFLAAHPQHADAVGDAPYVVLHGHRRLAAAKIAGLREVPVLVREDASRSGEDALIENVQRDDLTELEQAQAIQGLIGSYGYSQRDVAGRIGKSQGFVSQRLSLMRLRPELQEALAEGLLSVEDARRIARLPVEEQALPDAAAASVPKARRDYGVIKLSARSTPEEVVDGLRRHLSPAALERLVELLGSR
ncbi:ParB/RepB/Spo0J family partition protein [Streptomyces sp. NPDC050738]|uniref:ParB/RepB/Spo0J family partition protein n=1 Tax=Streptomyces sp. NPDC050738 TaxID=3154744 RepID=UPI0034166302